jgi:Zn-finger nucleic acid-binding protein
MNCPRCSNLVRKVKLRRIKHPSNATLDVCDRCGGMWLDGPEVKLLSEYKGGQK